MKMLRILIYLLLSILFSFSITFAGDNDDSHTIFYASSLTGGGSGSLDGAISGVSIGPKDAVIASDSTAGLVYFYHVTLTSEAENAPYVVRPDDVGAGVTSWELSKVVSGTSIYRIALSPDGYDARDSQPFWKNLSGQSLYITSAIFTSDDDDVNLDIYSGTTIFDYTKATDVFRSVTINTDENGVYYTQFLSGSTVIPDGCSIIADFDDSDVPDWIEIMIFGYYGD